MQNKSSKLMLKLTIMLSTIKLHEIANIPLAQINSKKNYMKCRFSLSHHIRQLYHAKYFGVTRALQLKM